MSINSLTKSLEEDEEFQALSYSEQLDVRSLLYGKELAKIPEFSTLHIAQKEQVLDKLIYAPPTFRDKSIQQDVVEIGKRIDQGDEKAKNLALGTTMTYQMEDASVFARFVKGTERLTAPITNTIEKAVTGQVDENAMYMDRFGSSKEYRKVSEYFEYRTYQDKKRSKTLALLGVELPLVGNVFQAAGLAIDMVPFMGIGRGIANATGISKFFNPLVRTTTAKSAVARFMGNAALPAVKRAAYDGLFGVARELVKESTGPNKKKNALTFVNGAKHYADYFIGDIIAFGALSLITPVAKSMLYPFKAAWNSKKGAQALGDLQTMMDSAVSGESLPKVLRDRLPKEVISKYDDIRKIAKLRDVEKLVPGSDDWYELVGLGMGFDVKKTATGDWKVTSIGEEAVSKIVKTPEEMSSYMSGVLKTSPIVKAAPTDASFLGASGKVRVFEKIRTTMPDKNTAVVDKMTRALTPQMNKLNTGNVKWFAKTFAAESGINPTTLDSLKVNIVDDYFTKKSTDVFDGKTLFVPRDIVSPTQQNRFVNQTVDALSEFVKDKPAFDGSKKVAETLLGGFQDRVYKQNLYSPSWVDYAVQKKMEGKLIQEGNDFRIQLKDGTMSDTFKSVQDVGDFVINQTLTEDIAKKALLEDHGMNLRFNPETKKYVVRRGKGIQDTFDSMDSMYKQHPEWKPKIPHELMPEFNFIDDALTEVTVRGGAANGDYQSVLRFMDKFRNYNKSNFTKRLPSKGGNIIFSRTNRSFEVELPDIGYRKNFTSLSKAKEFIDGGWKDWDSLTKVAAEKGYRMYSEKGNILLHQKGKANPIVAQTKEEIYSALKNVPIPEYAKDLSDLDDIFLDTLKKADGTPLKFEDNAFDADFISVYNETENMSIFNAVKGLYSPTDATLEHFGKQYGKMGQEALAMYKELQITRRAVDSEVFGMQKVIDQVFAPLNGTKKKNKILQVLGEIMQSETDPAQWSTLAEKMGHTLTDNDLKVMENVRNLLGKTDQEGLFLKFGIDGNKFLSNYLPRIKKWSIENAKDIANDADSTVYKRMFSGDATPNEINFFAKHRRVSEVVMSSYETNLQNVVSRYSAIGHRETVMGPVWDKAKKWFIENSGDMPTALHTRFQQYLDDVMGIPTDGQRAIKAMSFNVSKKIGDFLAKNKLLKKWGVQEKIITDDFLKVFQNLSYGGTMAFRPYLPIRNVMQVWTTLAPRVGNDIAMEGMKRVHADKTGSIFKKLASNGRIRAEMPLLFSDSEGFIKKFNHIGLKWYKHSDDLTRAVVDQSVSVLMEDGLKAYGNGAINKKQFLEITKLNTMDPFTRQGVMDLLSTNKFDAAVDMYAEKLSLETMFDYSAGGSPQAFKGVVGKLFGQMGTYPIYYLENVKRALRYSTTAQKLGFATQFVGNGLALWGAFKAAGMRADNFLPWNPARFSGGPYYNVMNKALTAIGSGPSAEQDRAALLRDLPKLLLPGGYQMQAMQKALEYMDQGDTYKAFLAATSAPIDPMF